MMSEEDMIHFFLQLFVSSEATKNLKKLGSVKDFEKMVSELVQTIDTEEVINRFLKSVREKPSAEKDAVRSKKARCEGNKLYKKCHTMDDYYDLFKSYNESIAYAPNKSEEMALSYANRAMVMFRLKYYTECLADINRAVAAKCPDDSMANLLIKKVRCMKILNHPDLHVVYKDSLNWINQHLSNRREVQAEIKKAYQEEASPCTKTMNVVPVREAVLEEMTKSCPNLDKIEIQKNSKGDLVLVATKDMEAGEVVAMQKIYTQIFNVEFPYLSCGECIMMCVNPIPCDSCSKVMYCTESCKEKAWTKHHEYECQIMGLLQALSWHLYIPTMICIYAMKQIGGISPLMREAYKMSKTEDIKSEHKIVNGVYPSESYKSVYYMPNKSPINMGYNFSADVARVSALVYLVATRTTLFNKQYRGDYSRVMKERLPRFFVSLVIRQTVVLQDMQLYHKSVNGKYAMNWIPVCPLFYIMNHSCNPNTLKLTIGDQHVLVAIDNIKKGDVIDYSFFRRPLVQEPLAHRKKFTAEMLSQECRCKVCEANVSHDLPSFQALEKNQQKLKKLSALKCKIENFIGKQRYLRKTAEEFREQTEELFKDLKVFFAIAPPLCKEVIGFKYFLLKIFYGDMQDVLYNSYLEMEFGQLCHC